MVAANVNRNTLPLSAGFPRWVAVGIVDCINKNLVSIRNLIDNQIRKALQLHIAKYSFGISCNKTIILRML